MQPNPQFVESLIALRSHYQSLYDQAERYLKDVRHQLTDHANTLLFDQNVEDQALVKSLMAMRQQWRELSEDCSSQIDHAREQLTHVNALLADQMVMQIPRDRSCNKEDSPKQHLHLSPPTNYSDKGCPQYSEKLLPSLPVSMEALTVNNENQNLGLSGTPEIKSDRRGRGVGGRVTTDPDILTAASNTIVSKLPTSEGFKAAVKIREFFVGDELGEKQESDSPAPFPLPLHDELPKEPGELAHNLDLDEGSKASSASVSSESAPIVTVQSEADLNISLTDEPKDELEPPDFQAVEDLLSKKAGAILHRDYILRVLYGELQPKDQQEKIATISEILAKGVVQGLWAEMPDEKDCYTLDLRLVEPELAAKASIQKPSGEPPKSLPRRKLAIKPLPNYQHLSLTDAIERVLMENAPQPLNIDTITQKLFGSIESTARKSVGDLLVKGVIKGRWQRVPGRGAARYAIR